MLCRKLFSEGPFPAPVSCRLGGATFSLAAQKRHPQSSLTRAATSLALPRRWSSARVAVCARCGAPCGGAGAAREWRCAPGGGAGAAREWQCAPGGGAGASRKRDITARPPMEAHQKAPRGPLLPRSLPWCLLQAVWSLEAALRIRAPVMTSVGCRSFRLFYHLRGCRGAGEE